MIQDCIKGALLKDMENIATNKVWNKIRNSRILITGGAGFIGYYLTLSALAANDIAGANNRIFVITRNAEKATCIFASLGERDDLELIGGDVAKDFPQEYSFEYLIHAASPADAKQFAANPVGTFWTNVMGTKSVLDCAVKSKAKSAVFVSSYTVYGDGVNGVPTISEDFVGKGNWSDASLCYMNGKRAGEMLCACYVKQYQVPVKIVRPGFIYGASSDDDPRVYAEIIRNIAHKEDVTLRSAGHVYRSMCYVTDLVRAIWGVLAFGENGEAYNVATENVSIREYAEAAAGLIGRQVCYADIRDKQVPAPTKVFGMMDCSKLKMTIPFVPIADIRTGVAMAVEILCDRVND